MLPRMAIVDLQKVIEEYGKMGFLSGPRQVGKTTLAQTYQKKFSQSLYFNWDIITDQKRLLRDPYFFEKENRDPRQPYLVVFDEIHKYGRWRNYLKGAYDKDKEEFRFLITGSGRLDLFKKGGDSLLGRYFSIPLFPLSVGELLNQAPAWADLKTTLLDGGSAEPRASEAYLQLYQFSGFPEPFVRASSSFYSTWFQERKSLLIREDIRQTTAIRELSLLEQFSHLLPERVGSPLSLNSMREDIGVSFETVRDWLFLLEQFYYVFRISPYSKKLTRALKKGPKIYLFDWAELPDGAARFENMVALHLYKAVRSWAARGEGKVSLSYVRDKEKREVDFLLCENDQPFCLVECKLNDETPSSALLDYQRKLKVPLAVQLLHKPGISKHMKDGTRICRVLSADRWLGLFP